MSSRRSPEVGSYIPKQSSPQKHLLRALISPTIAMRRQYLDLGIFALLCIPFSAALPVNDDKALVRRPKFEVAAVPAREYAPPAQEYAGPPPPQVPSPPPAPDLRAAQGRSSRI